MMKVALFLTILSALSRESEAACVTTGTFQGACSRTAIETALGPSCDLSTVFTTNLTSAVQDLCDSFAYPFANISDKGYHQDKNYMDGGTSWNEAQGRDNLKWDMWHAIKFINSHSSKKRVGWPSYMTSKVNADGKGSPHLSNFDLTDSCQSNTVLCCYLGDRFDNVIETAQADICYHDIANASKSAHVKRGFTLSRGSETNAYCVGFLWQNGTDSDRYKGNALLAASYMKTNNQGYVKNVPGAPMCACIEQMPVVSKADCVDVAVTSETTSVYYNASATSGPKITGNITANVQYGNCGGKSLKQKAIDLSIDLSKRIVDDCAPAAESALNNKFYVTGASNRYYKVNETKWKRVAGQGILFYPYGLNISIAEVQFRQLFAQSPNRIVYRYCPSCLDSMRNIYYKRKAGRPYPAEKNFLDLFLNTWSSANNTLGVDFDLFSTYQDALAETNAWIYCNYDGGFGFPRDCGPARNTGNNWNSYTRSGYYSDGFQNGFYVELP